MREASRVASNWRSEETLDEYLKRWKIVAIDHIDTRALVRHIRDKGAMRACLSTTDQRRGQRDRESASVAADGESRTGERASPPNMPYEFPRR